MNKIIKVLGLCIGLTAASCFPQDECYLNNYQNITNYKVEATEYTPKGIAIDQPINPEHQLDPNEIDWQVDELEKCLNENFKANPIISEEDASPENGWCYQRKFDKPIEIKRECLEVKVPDDLYQSVCSGQWLFPCDINPQACRDKGLEPEERCNCDCRAMIQDNNKIITNHKLNVFRGELARIITNCNNPWVVEQIRPCLTNPNYEE